MVDRASNNEPITPIPAVSFSNQIKLKLGEMLFHDKELSYDQRSSCSSCHDTQTNGADNMPIDKSIAGPPLALNTNTVFNAALSYKLDWEGNMTSLDAEAEMALQRYMAMTTTEVALRLRSNSDISRMFLSVYGRLPDRYDVLDAIEAYEQSLLTPGSPFDSWLEGKPTALSLEAQEGYQLFKSFGCISCHQGVNVGGNLFERSGIFHKFSWSSETILRVPSLRNVAVTAPYFHDGSVRDLKVAVKEMAFAQLDRQLTESDVASIVAFLASLTGTYEGRALSSGK